MALVFKRRNITVTVQTRDHRPAHVHVDSPEGSAKIDISEEGPRLMLLSKKKRDKSRASFDRMALQIVADNLEICRDTWRIYHGDI